MRIMHQFRTSGRNIFKKLQTNPNRFVAPLCAFLSFFILSFITGSFIIQPQPTKAVTGLGLVSAPTMALTSSNNISLDMTPTSTGAISSASHYLTASTNVPTGYNLSLATTTNNSSLPTVTGTLAQPTVLGNNTWGYALAKSGAIGITNGFDTSYAAPTPSTSSKWANPTVQTAIKNTGSSTTSDNTTIYYGAKITTSQPSGNYTNTIRYTATTNTTAIPNPNHHQRHPKQRYDEWRHGHHHCRHRLHCE